MLWSCKAIGLYNHKFDEVRSLSLIFSRRRGFTAGGWAILMGQSSVLVRGMATFNLPDVSPPTPVNLTAGLAKDQLLAFPAFKTWLSSLQHSLSLQRTNRHHTFHESPYQLRRIDVQAVDFFGGGRVGFVKLKAEVSNDDSESLPGSVFLRGGSVAMMVWV